MFTKMRKWLSRLFVSEITVQKYGSSMSDVPLNRKQRRAKASLKRKQAQRRKKHGN